MKQIKSTSGKKKKKTTLNAFKAFSVTTVLEVLFTSLILSIFPEFLCRIIHAHRCYWLAYGQHRNNSPYISSWLTGLATSPWDPLLMMWFRWNTSRGLRFKDSVWTRRICNHHRTLFARYKLLPTLKHWDTCTYTRKLTTLKHKKPWGGKHMLKHWMEKPVHPLPSSHIQCTYKLSR